MQSPVGSSINSEQQSRSQGVRYYEADKSVIRGGTNEDKWLGMIPGPLPIGWQVGLSSEIAVGPPPTATTPFRLEVWKAAGRIQFHI